MPKTITGTVKSYNVSPKGMYEGLLIETAKGTMQVNFPPEAGAAVSAAVTEGAAAQLSVEEEMTTGLRIIPFTG